MRRGEPIEDSVDERRNEVERDQLRVGMLDRRAGGLAVIDEGVSVTMPMREVEREPVAQHEEHLGRGIVVEVGEGAVVCGGQHDHLVRAGNTVADDRVLVRHDAHAPARRIGCAGAGPRDFGRCLALVAVAERAGGNGRRHGGPSVRNVSGRVERPGATMTPRPGHRSSRSSDAIGSSGYEVAAHTLGLVPVRFVIIGGGPAGNTAATVAASLGAEVTLIERDVVGGAAHLWDCIPSKAMVATGNELTELGHARTMGLDAHGVLDVDALRERIAGIENKLREGMTSLLESQGVRMIRGTGRLVGPRTVAAVTDQGVEEIEADAILLSTGSRPRIPDWATLDGERILDSRQAYPPPEIPEHLVVIGSGVTGVEFTHMFSALGAQVTLVVSRQQVLPYKDPEVAAVLEDEFLRRGVKLLERARARSEWHATATRSSSTATTAAASKVRTRCSRSGSIPNSDGLDCECAGVEVDERGFVPGNRHCQTNVPHIYSAGDLSGRLPLSSVAAMQGRKIAEHVMGLTARAHRHLDYDKAASAIFTDPEIADVGVAEAEAFAVGRKLRVTKVPFSSNPKALINGDTRGFVKILSDPATGVVLGGSIVGRNAAELISVIAVAVTNNLKVVDIVDSLLVHPALAESLADAAS